MRVKMTSEEEDVRRWTRLDWIRMVSMGGHLFYDGNAHLIKKKNRG